MITTKIQSGRRRGNSERSETPATFDFRNNANVSRVNSKQRSDVGQLNSRQNHNNYTITKQELSKIQRYQSFRSNANHVCYSLPRFSVPDETVRVQKDVQPGGACAADADPEDSDRGDLSRVDRSAGSGRHHVEPDGVSHCECGPDVEQPQLVGASEVLWACVHVSRECKLVHCVQI